MSWKTLERETSGSVAWIWMNRVALHNAFNETLIAERPGSEGQGHLEAAAFDQTT